MEPFVLNLSKSEEDIRAMKEAFPFWFLSSAVHFKKEQLPHAELVSLVKDKIITLHK